MTCELVTGAKGSPHVTAEQAGLLNIALAGSGNFLLNTQDQLKATIKTANEIEIARGDVLMQGRHVCITAPESVAIESGTLGFDRIDLIVLRYEKDPVTSYEKVALKVIKGTNVATGLNPAVPSYNSGDVVSGTAVLNDLPIYKVRISGLTPQTPELLLKDVLSTLTDLQKAISKQIDAAKLASNSVTNEKIANGAVNNAKLADGSVGSSKLVNGAVTNEKIANSSISEAKIANGAVTNAKVADSSIGASKLANSSVTNAKISDSAVGFSKIANSAVTGAKIADKSVTSAKITDKAITSAKLADGAVSWSKLADKSVGLSKLNADLQDVIPSTKWNKSNPNWTVINIGAYAIAFYSATVASPAISKKWGSLYCSSKQNGISYPSGTFCLEPTVFMSLSVAGSNTWITHSNNGTHLKTPEWYAVCPTTMVSDPGVIDIIAIGHRY